MSPASLPFEYPFQWDNESLREGAGVTPEGAAILKQRDRDLEDYLAGLGGGGVPSVFVAAADASVKSKSLADYVCSGSGDGAVIQAAHDALVAEASFGRVVLSEGNFSLGSGITLAHYVDLLGMGGGSYISASGVTAIATGYMSQVSRMTIESATVGVRLAGSYSSVTDCLITSGVDGVVVAAEKCRVSGVLCEYLSGWGVDTVAASSNDLVVSDCTLQVCNAGGIRFRSTRERAVGCVVREGGGVGFLLDGSDQSTLSACVCANEGVTYALSAVGASRACVTGCTLQASSLLDSASSRALINGCLFHLQDGVVTIDADNCAVFSSYFGDSADIVIGATADYTAFAHNYVFDGSLALTDGSVTSQIGINFSSAGAW